MVRKIIRLSFSHPKFQLPYFMIIEEEYVNGELVWANVIYQIDNINMDQIVIDGPIRIGKVWGGGSND